MDRRSFLVGSAAGVISGGTANAQTKPKLVLTGDLGIVGSRMGFLQRDYDVLGLDRKRGVHQDLEQAHAEWAQMLAGASVVVHLAWEIPWNNPDAFRPQWQAAAVRASMNLIAACQTHKISRLVFCSSMSARRSTVEAPYWVYPGAKRFVEDCVCASGLVATSVRLGSVPPSPRTDGMTDAQIAALFGRALAAEQIGYNMIEPTS